MGVGFFPCDRCSQTICDCGTYYRCGCDRRWCDKKCAEADGYKNEDYEDVGKEELKTCSFCRNEDVEDGPLLEYLLNHFSLTKEQAKSMYIASSLKSK